MNQTFLITLTLTLSLGVMTFVSAGLGHSYGQQNQTSNTTSTQPQQGQQQQNQTTEIGSANEIENLTAGNIPVSEMRPILKVKMIPLLEKDYKKNSQRVILI